MREAVIFPSTRRTAGAGRRRGAFSNRVLNRPNLHLETDVEVDKVLSTGAARPGVTFRRGTETLTARAKGEVVLCAGAIGSVSVLHRSGIGPAAWLNDLGIPVLHASEGVGRNLQDHLQLRMMYRVSGAKTLNQIYYAPLGRPLMALQYALLRRGPMTMAASQLGIFTRSDAGQERPNVQFHISPCRWTASARRCIVSRPSRWRRAILRPTSRGTVRLTSARDGKMEIKPNYLSTDQDRHIAAQCLRLTRKLMQQPALARYRPEEFRPGPSVSDGEADLIHAAGDIGTTIFHPVGTAKMGLASDPLAVLDERLKVRGVENLRVIDASVMPTLVSGNTNTPTIMIADKGAAMVIEDALAR